ncbi:MAG: ATP-grasp domain-containing protein, partial [Bacteroidales bacterium]|nr:ATP-grasp domain-containing protein [Bacteroidales bacterium]
MEKISLLVIDDNSSFVLPLLRSFSDHRNITIYLLVSSHKKPNYCRYSRYLKKIYTVSLTEENFVDEVKALVLKISADFIIPTREWISKLLWKNRSALEDVVRVHPVSDITTIETVNDKRKLNTWLESHNFPSSRSIFLNDRNCINSVPFCLSFPVLLKPALGLGGEGIRIAETAEQLKMILASGQLSEKEYFIQEYIKGYDIGVNIFSIDGKILCHTIQKAIFSGQLTYSRGTEFVKNQELFELASSIVEKLGYSGVANMDFRYDSMNCKYVLLDFNARYWSTLAGSMFMGVNFPLLVTEYSLGKKINYTGYTTGTFYCTKAAIKTLFRNILHKNKI